MRPGGLHRPVGAARWWGRPRRIAGSGAGPGGRTAVWRAASVVPRRDDAWWWVSGQINLISQAHGRFTSPSEGDNSLRAAKEQALSRIWTVYTGVKLPLHTELLFDIESAGGGGLSDALGLAGFTNLDVVRNPTLGSGALCRAREWYTPPYRAQPRARGRATECLLAGVARARATSRDPRRQAGAWRNFFDVNAVSAATAICNSQTGPSTITAPMSYAADTRNYTYAVIVEHATSRGGRSASAKR